MITSLLILIILGTAVPSYKNSVSTIAWGRLSTITLIFSSFLILNILYTSRLGTGLTLFSGFFKVNMINQSVEVILLIIAGLILIPLINTSSTYSNAVTSITNTIKGKFNKSIAAPADAWMDNYFLIILFNIIGACCLMTSNDLLILYVTIELQSFSLYILSTLNKNSINSASAGLKYFLIGSLASTFILLGIAFLYLLTGLTNFESLYIFFNITDYISSSALMMHFTDYNLWNFDSYSGLASQINNFVGYASPLIIIAFLFILIGTFIKIGAAPFHQWTPDVYDQVPTKVTIWLVIIPKLSIFILMLGILDMIMGTGNASTLTSIASLAMDGLTNPANAIAQQASQVTDYIMHLFLFKIFDKFGHANFFNINYDYVGWMNYYRTELPDKYFLLPFNMGNYSHLYHNTIFLSYFIPTIQEVLIKNVLIFISIISLIVGAVAGLYQIKIKRLLAYSGVNHLGFLILALAINTKTGLESFIFYLTQYSITNLNLFLILIAFGYLSYSSWNNNITGLANSTIAASTFTNPTIKEEFNSTIKFNNILSSTGPGLLTNQSSKNTVIENDQSSISKATSQDLNFISQLTGLFKNNSLLTISFAITLFSFAGVPPLLGFYGKMQVLYTAISVGFVFVSIIAINMSVISAYYYLKLIQVSNFINANLPSKTALQLSLGLVNAISIMASSPTINSNTTFLNKDLNNKTIINNSHSYLISIITLIILLFTFKTELLLNFTSLLTSYSYNI